jgi:NADH dehydrogenase/NADH:ubiquinone oxidoreductase subunit G
MSCHPLDCMACETAGDCALQDFADGFGSDGSCASKKKGMNRPTAAAYDLPPLRRHAGRVRLRLKRREAGIER